MLKFLTMTGHTFQRSDQNEAESHDQDRCQSEHDYQRILWEHVQSLIKGTSRDLCPISVDDDLAHPVSLDVIAGSLASLIAQGAIGKCRGVGGGGRVYSLNEASAVDFDSSEPRGLVFLRKEPGGPASATGELEEPLGD
jgi:hypothetical protein